MCTGVGLHVESAALGSERVCIVLDCRMLQDVLMAEVSYFIAVTAKPNKFQIYDIKGDGSVWEYESACVFNIRVFDDFQPWHPHSEFSLTL